MTDIYRNAEHYADPTAGAALRPIIAAESEEQKEVNKLIYVIKYVVHGAGFELVGRVQLRHRKSGREYR